MFLNRRNGRGETPPIRRQTVNKGHTLPGVYNMSNHLLVIDDATLHRMILCKLAEKSGFSVTGAASFDEAAERLRKSDFDCITLDLSLGERAGVEVLRVLSELGSRVPVIIISGSETAVLDETMKIGKSMGLEIQSSISKPVDLSVFRDELMKIGMQKLARAPA